MKILLAGGTGQVGQILSRALGAAGHEIVVLSRSTARSAGAPPPGGPRMMEWDARTPGPWRREMDGADVVINLAGRNVNCRYHARNRKLILDSRVDSARAVGAAIAQCARPPKVWLQASTATLYAHRYDAPNDEATGLIGGSEPGAPETWRFSIQVAKAWEQAALEAPAPRTRKVLLRSAMTMSPDAGGVFATLLALVRWGLGGRAGDGRQYVSWVHELDFVRAVQWLIDHEEMEGAVNICAPHPVPNAEFMRILRAAWGTRVGLPATRWTLALGAWALRSETELILKSRRVVPGRLLGAGFQFDYPHWENAARDLCARWRELRRSQV